jgi:nitroreductase
MQARSPTAPVDPRFVARWSPRSFLSDSLEAGQVASLFEAARWSPSCYNEQPWRFVYATADARRDHERIAGLLVEANRVWAARAPLLGVVFARRSFTHNGKPNRHGGFDCGAASLALVLQANELGLHAHFMAGFDADASYDALNVPRDDHEAFAAFAIGVRGPADALPEPYRGREQPSDRKPHGEIAFEGRMP